MRKLLLGTTAVVGAAFLAPAAMAQQAPTVRIGGFFLFEAYGIQDSADKAAVPISGGRNVGRRQVNFSQETEVHVFVDGKTANGLTYGAVVEFQIDGLQTYNNNGVTTRLGNGTGFNTDEAFAFIAGSFGTFKFGDEDSAGSLMQVRRPGIVGTNSDTYWDEQLVGGQISRMTGINDGGDATKIIYMTPQFFGFDFGVSYAPTGTEGELYPNPSGPTFSPTGARDRSTIQDEVSYVARYRASIAGVGVAASYAGQTAKPQQTGASTALQAVTANSIGLTATAYGFSVGGEYTWGAYTGVSVGRAALGTGRRDSTHWVVGSSYDIPGLPAQLGAWYGHATQDTNTAFTGGAVNGARVINAPEYRQTVWSIGANYTLAPGLVAYTSFTRLIEKNNIDVRGGATPTAARPFGVGRDANILMTGINLAF